jgi:hypothetical protein
MVENDGRFYDLSDKDTWQTPDELVTAISEYVDITLDPCAGLFTFIGDTNWTIQVPDEYPDDIDEVPSGWRYDRAFTNDDGDILECGEDSLDRAWDTGGVAYVNPPFSMKNEFIDKTIEEVYDFNHLDGAIVLTPDSTDVKSWWHGKLAPAANFVWFSEGRIGFVDPDTGELQDSPTFGTALHFIGDDDVWPDKLFEELNEIGDMMVRYNA